MFIIKFLAYTVFVAAIPLFLIATNVRALVNAPLLYRSGFDQYHIAAATGIEREELLSAGKQIRDYFNNEERWLDAVVRVGDDTYSLYNEREILHMWDVKVLVRTVYNVQVAAGLLILLIIPTGLALAPRTFLRTLFRLTAWGGAVTLAIVCLAGILSTTGFGQTFRIFHEIAFTNDLWILDPTHDFLLKMFPEGFFFDATMVLVAVTVVQSLWLLYAAAFALKVFPAAVFFRATVVQALTAFALSIYVLRMFPEGFFFEATMIVVTATVVQSLVMLVAWSFTLKDKRPDLAADDRREPPRRVREAQPDIVPTPPARTSRKRGAASRRSVRSEYVADNSIMGYYLFEAALLTLLPALLKRRRSRRAKLSSQKAAA